eukprot:SAG31_NODE_521_length_14624_cov_34.536867_2_plen_96_part_00
MKTLTPLIFRDLVAWSIDERDQLVCDRAPAVVGRTAAAPPAANHGFEAKRENEGGFVSRAAARAACCELMGARPSSARFCWDPDEAGRRRRAGRR